MKKFRLLFILALSFIASANLSAMTVTISGTVTNISGGAPIQNHVVSIQDTIPSSFVYFDNVLTDANGYYTVTIPNVPAGTYFTVSTLDCNAYYHVQMVNGNNSPVTANFQICAGNPPNLTVTVTGYVTNIANGSPVPNHMVEIQDTMSGSWFYYNSVYTNASGMYTFTIPNVPPNTWFWVYTLDCNYAFHSIIVNGNQGYCGGTNFQICYNMPTITVSISGTVTSTNTGAPVPNHIVVIQSDSSSGGYTYYNQLITNSAGFYSATIQNVPQGTIFEVYTYDCNNSVHQQFVNGDNTPITVNFQICTGTQTTWDIYGLVFAGNALLDAGKVQLIKIDSLNNAFVTDTWYIQDTAPGHYEFHNVLSGNYYLKAFPADSSNFFGQYAPTYYDTTIYWTNAIVVHPQNQYTCDIHLVPLNSYNSGNGSINGNITENTKTSIPLANAEVLLLDPDNHPLTYTMTNVNGEYSFQNLAFGTYIVYPEIPKVTTVPYTVNLDAAHPSATVNFIIDNGVIYTGIHESPSIEISGISEVFPNPASDQVKINLVTTRETPVTMTIINSMGQSLKDLTLKLLKGGNTISLPVSDLSDGFYYLRIQSTGGSIMKKFIISK